VTERSWPHGLTRLIGSPTVEMLGILIGPDGLVEDAQGVVHLVSGRDDVGELDGRLDEHETKTLADGFGQS
jgi:hypothetical protein